MSEEVLEMNFGKSNFNGFIFSLCVRLSQFPGKALSPNDYSKISHVQFLPYQETSFGFGELLKYV